jgi:hypothetical protein
LLFSSDVTADWKASAEKKHFADNFQNDKPGFDLGAHGSSDPDISSAIERRAGVDTLKAAGGVRRPCAVGISPSAAGVVEF